jgi:GH18 family chitinase
MSFTNTFKKDFHGSWESFTGLNAPLYNRSNEVEDQGILNVDWAVNYWLMNGMPAEKLILGLAAYGRTFILTNSSNSKPGDAAKGAGRAGSQTGQDGFISYYEICEKLSQGWIRVWQEEHKAPYAYSGVNWVGYDDIESLTIKVDYLKSKKLGGAMVWAIDLDDFSGTYCNQGKYPLITLIKSRLTFLTSSTPSVEEIMSTTQLISKDSSTKMNSFTNLEVLVSRTTTPLVFYRSDLQKQKLICYFSSVSVHANATLGRYNFEADLCTHIIYLNVHLENFIIGDLTKLDECWCF